MKLFLSLAVIIIGCITTPVLPQQQQQEAQYCLTPENHYGTCVTLSYCPRVQQHDIAAQRACGTRSINGDPVVCCTSPLTNPQTTEAPYQPDFSSNNPFLPNQQSQTQRTTRSTTTAPQTFFTQPTTTNENLNDKIAFECRGPDARDGICIPVEDCQILTDQLLAKQFDKRFFRFLTASHTICGGGPTNVCCPRSLQRHTTTSAPLIRSSSEIPTRLPTVQEGCGYNNNLFKKIVGGEVSKKGAWPWIALIGYDDGLSATPFKCGGTLITARHVVTAAHCLRNDLSFVRLGEHDLTTDTEADHIDIRVSRSIMHPDYNRRKGHSDIAILYLERNVDFTKFILPICLPITPELQKKSYVRYTPFVVGWGKTMEGGLSSNVLQELQILIYDNQVCRKSYQRLNPLFTENQFDKAVLCAGVSTGGKDACHGDSGGPLMAPENYGNGENRFYLIGVVSYGIGCARPETPGVYSSTQYFMDWIKQKVADTP